MTYRLDPAPPCGGDEGSHETITGIETLLLGLKLGDRKVKHVSVNRIVLDIEFEE